MALTVTTLIGNVSGTSQLVNLPDKCPFCHNAIQPIALYGAQYNTGKFTVFMKCPSLLCRESFIAYYESIEPKMNPNKIQYQGRTSFGKMQMRVFSDDIKTISASFENIYNESYAAEQQGYLEICGVGYRKALEFLIKDYAIKNHPTQKESIEKKLLGPCIKDYISSENIKSVAKRAVWLGNDETHYVRKWEGRNLDDLKKLIDLTIHWMEAEILTASFESEMPE